MEKPTKEEIEKVKPLLKQIPEFKDIEILDTWFEDIDRLEEDVKKARNHLAKAKRERKKQPEIKVQTLVTEEIKTIKSYQINIKKDGKPFYICDW